MTIDRLLNTKEVCAIIGVTKPTLRKMYEEGRFPEPKRISEGRIAWKLSTVQEWMEAL